MSKKYLVPILSLFVISILGACSTQQPDPQLQDLESFVNTETTKIYKQEELKHKKVKELIPDTWYTIDNGLKIKETSINKNGQEIDTVSILQIDPELYSFSLQQDIDHPKTIHDWSKELQSLIVINGSYFKEDNTPSGGLILKHEQFGTLTKDGSNGYTGTLLINNGKPEIRFLPNQHLTDDLPEYLLQTYPTLLHTQGKDNIKKDSGKTARRTVLAQDLNRNILIITTQKPAMSLYGLMQWLIGSELNIDTAINLDGGPSTGLVINHPDFEYSVASFAVPNVISVNKR